MRAISFSLSLLALLSATGHAAPPSGSPCMTNPTLPECVWWHAQVNDATDSPCCGGPGQDGHVLTQWSPGFRPREDDWRVVSTPAFDDGFAPSGYQVWIQGAWYRTRRGPPLQGEGLVGNVRRSCWNGVGFLVLF